MLLSVHYWPWYKLRIQHLALIVLIICFPGQKSPFLRSVNAQIWTDCNIEECSAASTLLGGRAHGSPLTDPTGQGNFPSRDTTRTGHKVTSPCQKKGGNKSGCCTVAQQRSLAQWKKTSIHHTDTEPLTGLSSVGAIVSVLQGWTMWPDPAFHALPVAFSYIHKQMWAPF